MRPLRANSNSNSKIYVLDPIALLPQLPTLLLTQQSYRSLHVPCFLSNLAYQTPLQHHRTQIPSWHSSTPNHLDQEPTYPAPSPPSSYWLLKATKLAPCMQVQPPAKNYKINYLSRALPCFHFASYLLRPYSYVPNHHPIQPIP